MRDDEPSGIIYRTHENNAPAAAAAAETTDWSGWERWLRSHLNIERENIFDGIVDTLATMEEKRDEQFRKLELRVAELSGEVSALMALLQTKAADVVPSPRKHG